MNGLFGERVSPRLALNVKNVVIPAKAGIHLDLIPLI